MGITAHRMPEEKRDTVRKRPNTSSHVKTHTLTDAHHRLYINILNKAHYSYYRKIITLSLKETF